MKLMFTMHFRDTPSDRRELWRMVAEGWRHRAYMVRQPLLGKLGPGEGGLLSIEVTVYDTSRSKR